MEELLRVILLDWLRSDTELAAGLNAICEEAPTRTSLPWLAIAASASSDWSTKTERGREVRVAFELHCRGAGPGAAALVAAIEGRIETLPKTQNDFVIAFTRFLRARSEQRPGNHRAILVEYAFRLLAS